VSRLGEAKRDTGEQLVSGERDKRLATLGELPRGVGFYVWVIAGALPLSPFVWKGERQGATTRQIKKQESTLRTRGDRMIADWS
jgi:hypothetical protein